MNYLNGVWSDTYILQIFIQQALKRLGKSLYEKLILKTYSFLSKRKMFKKLEKRIVLAFTSAFGYEYEKKYLTFVSKNTFKRYLITIDRRRRQKDTMLLSKILLYSCIIIPYIMEENIFVVIVYRLLVQQKY